MNDEKMINAIRCGNEVAIGEAITKYSKLMWSIASSVLHNVASDQDIEECVADVFVYLWKNAERYDASRGTLKIWLSVVTRSKAVDRYRELSKNNTVALNEEMFAKEIGICEGIITEETKIMLITAVRALEEPEREILIRRYYYEQKPKEIALALNMPVKKIENHLYRAKLKLRESIAI